MMVKQKKCHISIPLKMTAFTLFLFLIFWFFADTPCLACDSFPSTFSLQIIKEKETVVLPLNYPETEMPYIPTSVLIKELGFSVLPQTFKAEATATLIVRSGYLLYLLPDGSHFISQKEGLTTYRSHPEKTAVLYNEELWLPISMLPYMGINYRLYPLQNIVQISLLPAKKAAFGPLTTALTPVFLLK